jgi:chaperone BCS1
MRNKAMYQKQGRQYQMGILMHGHPGCGKTSFIKVMSRELQLDVYTITLSQIRTNEQLIAAFNKTPQGPHILVIEDIDCVDSYKNRAFRVVPSTQPNSDVVQAILQRFVDTEGGEYFDTPSIKQAAKGKDARTSSGSTALTLDVLLNLIDGLREALGRILVITTNYRDRLDPAITRPGRVDLELEFKKSNHEQFQQIYKAYYDEELPQQALSQFVEYAYSPAQLIQYATEYNSAEFIEHSCAKVAPQQLDHELGSQSQ